MCQFFSDVCVSSSVMYVSVCAFSYYHTVFGIGYVCLCMCETFQEPSFTISLVFGVVYVNLCMCQIFEEPSLNTLMCLFESCQIYQIFEEFQYFQCPKVYHCLYAKC